jgi:hypothetical protein
MSLINKLFSKKNDFLRKVSTPFFNDKGELISGEEKMESLIDKISKNKGRIVNIYYSKTQYTFTDWEMNNRQDIHTDFEETYLIHYKSSKRIE